MEADFAQALDCLVPAITRIARHRLADENDVADVVQSTLLVLLQQHETGTEIDDLPRYAAGITKRLAAGLFRARRREEAAGLVHVARVATESDDEMRAVLDGLEVWLLPVLTPLQRRVYDGLRRDLSDAAIADLVGLQVRAVATARQRIVKKARKVLFRFPAWRRLGASEEAAPDRQTDRQTDSGA